MLHDIKTLRENSGLSQAEFAKLYGMSTHAVQSWEQGTRKPQTSTLLMLNRIYQLEALHDTAEYRLAHNELCHKFGEKDVLTSYKSKDYPFEACFYIKSRDLYIELFTSWMHGEHWFDANLDGKELKTWKNAAMKNPIYHIAVNTRTHEDVEKRQAAENNNINLVVFWANDLSDFYEWIYAGCPNGNAGEWRNNIIPVQKHVSKCQKSKTPDGFEFDEDTREQLIGRMDIYKVYNGCDIQIHIPEPVIRAGLRHKFGTENVIENYICDEYPFPHIYIRSRDMHIDILNEPVHNGRWYMKNLEYDRRETEKLADIHDANTLFHWTLIDQLKRWYAGYHKLNYLVFWNPNLRDYKSWLDAGCPDGYDWYEVKSWQHGAVK